MKKFLLVLTLSLGVFCFAPAKAEAAHISFSIGGMMPPVIVTDNCYRGYSTYYTTPYYGNSFYFSTGRHHRMGPPPPHHHGHHGGHHRGPHGGHHGGGHGPHGGHR